MELKHINKMKNYKPKWFLNDNDERVKLCEKCNFYMPKNTNHCEDCQICIADLDHHCQFYSKCIG